MSTKLSCCASHGRFPQCFEQRTHHHPHDDTIHQEIQISIDSFLAISYYASYRKSWYLQCGNLFDQTSILRVEWPSSLDNLIYTVDERTITILVFLRSALGAIEFIFQNGFESSRPIVFAMFRLLSWSSSIRNSTWRNSWRNMKVEGVIVREPSIHCNPPSECSFSQSLHRRHKHGWRIQIFLTTSSPSKVRSSIHVRLSCWLHHQEYGEISSCDRHACEVSIYFDSTSRHIEEWAFVFDRASSSRTCTHESILLMKSMEVSDDRQMSYLSCRPIN